MIFHFSFNIEIGKNLLFSQKKTKLKSKSVILHAQHNTFQKLYSVQKEPCNKKNFP